MKNQIELLQDLLWEIRELRKAIEDKTETNHKREARDEKCLSWASIKKAAFEPIEDPAHIAVEVFFEHGAINRRMICTKCESELPNLSRTLEFNMCPFCGAGFKNGGKK